MPPEAALPARPGASHAQTVTNMGVAARRCARQRLSLFLSLLQLATRTRLSRRAPTPSGGVVLPSEDSPPRVCTGYQRPAPLPLLATAYPVLRVRRVPAASTVTPPGNGPPCILRLCAGCQRPAPLPLLATARPAHDRPLRAHSVSAAPSKAYNPAATGFRGLPSYIRRRSLKTACQTL